MNYSSMLEGLFNTEHNNEDLPVSKEKLNLAASYIYYITEFSTMEVEMRIQLGAEIYDDPFLVELIHKIHKLCDDMDNVVLDIVNGGDGWKEKSEDIEKQKEGLLNSILMTVLFGGRHD